jgi:hypothetical protein
MRQWYFIEDFSQHGPVSEAELSVFIENGRLTPESLVWAEGIEDWTPLSEITDLHLSPYAPPASDANGGVDWDANIPSGPQVRPWIRYWARSFDTAILAVAANLALEFIYPEALVATDTILGVIVGATAVPVEAAMFAAFGTTPFKALLNIKVRNRNGTRLSFSDALKRTFRVWVFGEALSVPLVSWIANIAAYKRLTDTGTTSWDAGRYVVSHRSIEAWRIILIILVLIGITAALTYADMEF